MLGVVLYTSPAVLPSGFHTAAFDKKNDEYLFIKNITYSFYLPGLLQVWNLRERGGVEERILVLLVHTVSGTVDWGSQDMGTWLIL